MSKKTSVILVTNVLWLLLLAAPGLADPIIIPESDYGPITPVPNCTFPSAQVTRCTITLPVTVLGDVVLSSAREALEPVGIFPNSRDPLSDLLRFSTTPAGAVIAELFSDTSAIPAANNPVTIEEKGTFTSYSPVAGQPGFSQQYSIYSDPPPAVPEPSTLSLLGPGLGGVLSLVLLRSRRRMNRRVKLTR